MESLEFLQLPLFQERILPEGGDAKSAGGLWWGRDGEDNADSRSGQEWVVHLFKEGGNPYRAVSGGGELAP